MQAGGMRRPVTRNRCPGVPSGQFTRAEQPHSHTRFQPQAVCAWGHSHGVTHQPLSVLGQTPVAHCHQQELEHP